ncbi:MAG TPA: VWA domain-containing protein [Thermotogota bacterium]|nr:VWA domain-containing protein [Thermotogota bacterium]HRW92092.1 VWA domain-containing protein [Thermotogota bacterium]
MKFSNPSALFLLLALVPYLLLVMRKVRLVSRTLDRFFSVDSIRELFRGYRIRRMVWKYTLFFVALFLGILGLAGPYFGSQVVAVESRSVDMVIALDCSPSMAAQDWLPSRFDVARDEVTRILKGINARVCLLPFSGEAFLTTPFTHDLDAVMMIMDGMRPGFIQTTGTDMDVLFQKILDEFDNIRRIKEELQMGSFEEPRILFLLTDGDGQNWPSDLTLRALKARGIEVWIEVIATSRGAKVPIYDDYGEIAYYLEQGGQPYLSLPDLDRLKRIINQTGGLLHVYSPGSPMSNRAIARINPEEFASRYSQSVEIREEGFPLMGILAALALFLGMVL